MNPHDPDPRAAAALAELLDAGVRYGPEYRNGLSNHLPMALVALHRLGAGEARLRAFASSHGRRLEPASADGVTAEGSPGWRDRLGDVAAFGPGFRQFRNELTCSTADAVLRKALPDLMPGVAAAAFHGLIRTAYAVVAGHAGELAAGLAYWACRHLPLGPGLPAGGALDVVRWSAQVEQRLSARTSRGGLIFEQMKDVAGKDGFAPAVAGLRLTPGTLKEMSALAAERYLQTRDFTVLHLITSGHALRILGPWLDEPDEALRWYALAYAAALVASRTTGPGPVGRAVEPQQWNSIFASAMASDDEHTIKLVYTCHEEAAHYGDDRYRSVATLATRR